MYRSIWPNEKTSPVKLPIITIFDVNGLTSCTIFEEAVMKFNSLPMVKSNMDKSHEYHVDRVSEGGEEAVSYINDARYVAGRGSNPPTDRVKFHKNFLSKNCL